MKLRHVETFEEAEELLGKTGSSDQIQESRADSGSDPIAEMLSFTEPARSPEKKARTEKSKTRSGGAFIAKKGDKLTIPKGAAAKNDFSFLKGCWRSRAVTYYDNFTPHQTPAELCFNGGNNGSFLSKIDKVCKARATARFKSGILLIQAGRGPCQAGSRYAYTMPRLFQCEGECDNTECYILAKDDINKNRRFKSRARFYKK